MIRPRTIRGQLTRVLVVSVALALVLLGVIVAREVRSYRDTDTTVRAVSLALSVQDTVHELQRERGLSNGLLGGDPTLRPTVDDQRAATDRALLALHTTLLADAPGAAQAREALGQLDALGDTRARIDAGGLERAAAFRFYTGAIGALGRTRSALDHARDDQVWRGLQGLYTLGDAKEYTGQERGFLNGVFTAGGFGPGEYVEFLNIRAARTAAEAAFRQDASADRRAGFDAALRSEDAVRAADLEAVALASDRGPLVRPVAAADWWARMTAVIDAQRGVQGAIGADIEARADRLRADAATTLGVYTGAAVLALLALVLLVVASARAIVRPLAALAGEAHDVASHRLPELVEAWHTTDGAEPAPPRPVRTTPGASTEIVSVAEAFDRVQVTAYELASEQALLQRNTTESLANLGRRNQNLVRRQLALISEFEREELDPKMLANMFELDHLATRMRRNAESLLVLVGEASPRRWAEPIPLTDVIRAALSEVDDYRRVALRRVDDVPITGAVVSELAHMVAELIENGLAFSPPDLEVEIYGRRLGRQYLLAIVDHGVGMPAEQLAEANARLRGEAEFLVAPTRFLGHYVVGRLARRLGIDVELTVSPVSGVVARLMLPASLLAETPAAQPDPVGSGNSSRNDDSLSGNGLAPSAPALSGNGIPANSDSLSENGAPQPGTSPFGSVVPAVLTSPAAVSTGARHEPDSSAGHTVSADAHLTEPEEVRGRHAWARSPGDTSQWATGNTADGPAWQFDSTATQDNSSGRHSIPADTPQVSGPRPDPFPTLPPGPMKDSLYAAAAERGRLTVATPDADTPPVAEVQRTRNGLVKRARKTREAGTRPATTPRHPAAPAADRSPDQVRSMLSGFRTGHERGATAERPRIAVPTTEEDHR
ncbi:nitrate- and nitrite sensing domain-containing protein [Nocardia blacklockiae]|uniref:nitrate- and nitrite sensing domain-containing protein n=1 Tax=Nocardia blacklockiae TaxID=480036 RepID=UPI001895C796|nr:nitrate- and nitrite sensing domain-containing protein [Nocardia blacklockiae]MBF6172014.1 nitrate- and nitrite sensing domain-containing protein [Nocardia blacklockiae]